MPSAHSGQPALPPIEAPAPHHSPHPRHSRPRRRWPWVLGGLAAAVVLGVAAVLGWYALALRPVQPHSSQTVAFQLQSGSGLPQIARQLEHQRLIRSGLAFEVYVALKGQRHSLEAGTYDLSSGDSVSTITNILTQGKIASNTLVVPEGTTITKIETLAAKKGISSTAFTAALGDSYNAPILASRPAGDSSLEGYLFPDSYELGSSPTAHAIIQNMLTVFGQEVTQAKLAQGYAAEGLTLHQGVTLASIVEKEAGTPQDRPIIAQVFLSRLKLGMPLQSDVTVNYASLLTGLPFSTTLNSPYNTYLHTGLPPGPICNPGLSAMEAVAHPANTDYLYFLADKNGVVHYAQTAAQHEANVQKYLGGQ